MIEHENFSESAKNQQKLASSVRVPSDGVEKIATAKKRKTKKSITEQILRGIADTDAPSLRDYIIEDVIVPSCRNMLADLVHDSTDILIYGSTRGRKRSSSTSRKTSWSLTEDKEDYTTHFSSVKNTRTASKRRSNVVEEIIFSDRSESKKVLSTVVDYAKSYGSVPVSYYYQLIENAPEPQSTDRHWGWSYDDLNPMPAIVSDSDGYYIDFPELRPV